MPADHTSLFAEIFKIEKPDAGTRLVHARISDETKDLDDQIADKAWLDRALPDWFKWGNVRDMHQPNVVGKATELTDVPDQKGFDGVLKIVDPLAIRKLDEGLYGGVSIGISKPRVVNERGTMVSPDKPGRIVGGKIVEVSLVDHPANENCKLALVLAKSATGNRGTLRLLAEPEEIKRDFSDKERTRLASEGKAMPDGSFPISNEQDLHNAIRLAGHGKNPAAAKRHIIARANAMGMSDAIPADWKNVIADLTKDAEVPTLIGHEAAHNAPLADAMAAIKTLIAQELDEPESEFDCINWLSGIGKSLEAWAENEATEDDDDEADMTMSHDVDLYKATLTDFIEIALEPDINKRRVFYSREHRASVEQALRNLTGMLAGDMQGPVSPDTTGDDAAPIAEGELMRDGDSRVRTPSGVTQAGPNTENNPATQPDSPMAPGYELRNTSTAVSITDVPTTARPANVAQAGYDGAQTSQTAGGGSPATGAGAAAQPTPAMTRGTEPDLTKAAVEPDLTKAVVADMVKAIFPDLLKEYREVLKEELKAEFATKSLEADVERLGKRAQPNNGPLLGEGTRVITKQFAVNNTMNSGEIPQDVLDKMVRYSELAKSDQVETASSAKSMLKKLTQEYFAPVS